MEDQICALIKISLTTQSLEQAYNNPVALSCQFFAVFQGYENNNCFSVIFSHRLTIRVEECLRMD
ncbi:hypothetical protein PILCRDRAFT_819685 [Piloderma croceum F 1598]|uniref:Uncharacterized protein n=1 Tax=Piloderma croceum (strain F 1598) TaxID=765440 RepID=A0A0C3BAX0_PILCF|nr:hypothetical protein PILCRDRAFT_819685 [Piloderma croceum F 1598]